MGGGPGLDVAVLAVAVVELRNHSRSPGTVQMPDLLDQMIPAYIRVCVIGLHPVRIIHGVDPAGLPDVGEVEGTKVVDHLLDPAACIEDILLAIAGGGEGGIIDDLALFEGQEKGVIS